MGPQPPIDGPVLDVEPDDDVIAPDEADLDGQDDDPADIKTASVVPEDDTASTATPRRIWSDEMSSGLVSCYLFQIAGRQCALRQKACWRQLSWPCLKGSDKTLC